MSDLTHIYSCTNADGETTFQMWVHDFPQDNKVHEVNFSYNSETKTAKVFIDHQQHKYTMISETDKDISGGMNMRKTK